MQSNLSELDGTMHRIVANLSYVSKGAVGFGERERIAIFSAALRSLFAGEKNGNWSFALNFCFFLFKQKENEKEN